MSVSGCATGLNVMSSTQTCEPPADTRTKSMSARPSGDCRTAARPYGEEFAIGARRSGVLASDPEKASTVTLEDEETHIETLACGRANVTTSEPPKSTRTERSLSWPGLL